jgi:ribosome modulation factor
MITRASIAAFLATPLLGIFLGAAGPADGGSAAEQSRTLRTATHVVALAADGSRAAVATACGPRVYELFAWSPVRRSVVSIAPRRQRRCHGASTGEGILEAGIAGRSLAWVPFAGGNFREQWLVTAPVRRPLATTKLVDVRVHSTAGVVGDWVGNVHGDGSLLVFNTWSVCESNADDQEVRCPEGTPPGIHIYDEKLWRIVGPRKRLILASPDELTVLSVAAGRILVQRADGSLELRGPDGRLLRSFPFAPDEVRGALLDSSELVVLHRVRGRLAWSVFDPESDEERTLAAQTGAIPADVERGLLVYIVGRVVHVQRLADGRQARFTTPRGSYPDAQIEPSGLFYSYALGREGRVRFVPLGQIRFR